MNNTEKARLRAELRALVAENSRFLNLKPGADTDLVNRLLDAGALMVGDRASMPCGRDPVGYASEVIRPDREGGAYLFAEPTPPKPTKPKPSSAAPPDVSTPAKAEKTRAQRLAEITAKLAKANGE